MKDFFLNFFFFNLFKIAPTKYQGCTQREIQPNSTDSDIMIELYEETPPKSFK